MVRAFPWARLVCAAAALAAAAGAAAALAGRPVAWWLPAGAAVLLVGGFAVGLAFAGTGLFARPIVAALPERAAGRVALTFDDGPDPVATRAIADLLDARGHLGTFFVIGARAAGERALLEDLLRRGHALGNHSWEHRRTTPLRSRRALERDFARAQAWLTEVGARGRWFRAPIGIVSPPVAAAVRRAGLELVGWTRSARDGVATTPERALRRLLPALKPGAILALHDGVERGARRPIAPALLPALLDALESRGLRSVTIDQLLEPERS